MPDGAGIAPDIHARRVADLQAERDLYARGARREDVDLIDEIARRVRSNEFSTPQIIEAARIEAKNGRDDLRWALVRSRGEKADSPRSLGKLLGHLKGEVVEQVSDDDVDGSLWKLHWPRRTWGV